MTDAFSQPRSSEYLEQFDQQPFAIKLARAAGRYLVPGLELARPEDPPSKCMHLDERPEHAFKALKVRGWYLGVRLPSSNGHVDPRLIEEARHVISRVVELDEIAREDTRDHGDGTEYNEDLIDIELKPGEAVFHYVAGTVNTEWAVSFVKSEDGDWIFRGFV